MDDHIQKAYFKYINDSSEMNFRLLFTLSHKQLLQFLVAKKMMFDDAEDLLQDFFIREFDQCLKTYDSNKKRSFFNFMRHIVFLRYLSFYDLNRFKKEIPIQQDQKDLTNILHDNYSYEDNLITKFVQNEVISLFSNLILSIENQNHRFAFILKLCLPITLSSKEAASILGCSTSTYNTWIHRASKDLFYNLKDLQKSGKLKFDLNDAYHILKSKVHNKAFSIDTKMLFKIKDKKTKEILELKLFYKMASDSIASKTHLSTKQVNETFRKGMFELLNLFSKSEILLS